MVILVPILSLVLIYALIVGGKVVAASRALTGRGGDLTRILVVADQEAGQAALRRHIERAVEPLGDFREPAGEEGAVSVGESREDKASDSVGAGKHLSKGPDYSSGY